MKKCFVILLSFFLAGCDFQMAGTTEGSSQNTTDDEIQDIGGNPSTGSQDIYASANLNNLCIDEFECGAPYDVLPDEFYNTGNAQLTDSDICDFDYNPNITSTFVLNRVSGSVNGLDLLFSKEDLFLWPGMPSVIKSIRIS